jgi:MFS family permease
VAHHLTDGSKHAVGTATAVLTTAQGIGAVAGAFALTPLALRFGRGRVVLAQMFALCLALIAYDISPTLALAAVALTLVGAIYIGVLSGLSTVIQLQAPPEYRGRILSLYFVALGVLYPIGALTQGPIADAVGLSVTTSVAAFLCLALLAGIGLARPQVFRALGRDGPLQPAPVEF